MLRRRRDPELGLPEQLVNDIIRLLMRIDERLERIEQVLLEDEDEEDEG